MRASILAALLAVPFLLCCSDDNAEPTVDTGVADSVVVDGLVSDGGSTDLALGCAALSDALTDRQNYQVLLSCLRDSGAPTADKEQAITTFVRLVEANDGFPIVEQSKVVFVYVRKAELDLDDDDNADEDFNLSARQEPISVAGSFNGWDVAAQPLTHEGHDFFHAEVALDVSGKERYQYKFVAKNSSGADVWFSDPLSRRFDFDQFGRYSIIRGGDDTNGDGVGHLEQIFSVHATQLDDERSIFIYLPRNYDHEPSKRYPVLYMHDGRSLFDLAQPLGSESSTWDVDGVVEAEIRAGHIQELIVVGIPHAFDRRFEEYTHVQDALQSGGLPVGGEGDAYLDFVVNDLKPLVDARYRTLSDRAHTGIFGASLGGVISFYAGLKHPTVFKYVGGMSSTLGWGKINLDNPTIAELYQQEANLASHDQVYYLDSGDDPQNPQNPPTCPLTSRIGEDNYCETVAFRDVLVSKGIDTFPADPDSFPLAPASINIYYHHEPDAVHDYAAWKGRFYRPLRLFFPK